VPHSAAVQKVAANDAEVVDGEGARLDRPRHIDGCEVSLAGKKYVLLAACLALLAAGFAAYHFWPRSNPPSGPAKITQISQWNKPMNHARLSPDGHTVAFTSLAGGIDQVFLMLTSGGEPLQLTNDEGDKSVDSFSPDGKEVYYARSLGRDEVWAVPTLGGAPRRVVSGYHVVPSPDGAFIYYLKSDSSVIFRAGKFGLNEELVYKSEITGLFFIPLLIFPSSNDLLVYRQPWKGGKLMGPAQVALKLPFTFPLFDGGNTYDFSRDLSTIVYARPGGHADLYLLSQK
jgi:hypothetical protein